MKKINIILSMVMAVFSFTALSAQSSKTTDKIATADSVVYQCPMKCEGEKTYSKAGKCPVCNMNLKAKTPAVAAAQYQCPMKCEGDKMYSKEGKCPVCNMALKKINPGKEKTGHDGHNH